MDTQRLVAAVEAFGSMISELYSIHVRSGVLWARWLQASRFSLLSSRGRLVSGIVLLDYIFPTLQHKTTSRGRSVDMVTHTG
jgi:hypothetical protein